MLTRELIAKVRKLEIKTRKIVEDIAGGAYHSMFKGRGIEFSEVRAYSVEDDVRDIDWNVTARMGAPYIKKYVEERELTVILAVDLSGSVEFGSTGTSKRDKMAEVAALLAFSAIRNHDKVGLLLFTDKDELYLPPKSGRFHVLRVIRELVGCEVSGKGTNLPYALEFLSRSLKKRSVVFLLSDFVDGGDWEKPLKLLARRHDVAAFRVLDPLEFSMPQSPVLQLADSETSKTFLYGSGKNIYQEVQEALRKETEEHLRKSGVDMVDIPTEKDVVPPLIRFFKSRRLQSRRA